MKPQTIIKLAYFTRRFSRYEHPLFYRLSRNLLKLIYPRNGHKVLKTVLPYDQGLININTGNMHEYEIMFFHSLEPAVTNLIKRIVKPGDSCIDVGANIGGITLVMAYAAGGGGRVVAVEPHPVIARRLRDNIDLNRLNNCRVIQAAVSDKEGTATLYCTPEESFHQGWSSLKPSGKTPNRVTVDTVTGKRLKQEIGTGPLTFVKIDVEGHDFIVLKELSWAMSEHMPHVVLEYGKKGWEEHGSNLKDMLELVGDMGYGVYYMKHDLIFPISEDLPDTCDLLCVPRLENKR